MRKFLDIIREPIAKTEADRVGCGECPVNMACVLEEGGTGWTFDCCHVTSLRVDGLVLTIDCGRHNFEKNNEVGKWKVCPLCSGSIIEVVERAKRSGANDPNRFVLTEHAKVPLEERVKLWKAKHAEALKRLAAEKERFE